MEHKYEGYTIKKGDIRMAEFYVYYSANNTLEYVQRYELDVHSCVYHFMIYRVVKVYQTKMLSSFFLSECECIYLESFIFSKGLILFPSFFHSSPHPLITTYTTQLSEIKKENVQKSFSVFINVAMLLSIKKKRTRFSRVSKVLLAFYHSIPFHSIPFFSVCVSHSSIFIL